MKKIDWNELITLLSPHSYCLASTVGIDGRPNLIGLCWWTICSWEPPMVAISVGKTRYSRTCLDQCPEFVLCFPSVEQVRGAWLCGNVSGKRVDKFQAGGFEPVKADMVKPPLIKGAVACLECIVKTKLEVGDHILYISEVKAIHGDLTHKMHIYTIHYEKPIGIDCDGNVNLALDYE